MIETVVNMRDANNTLTGYLMNGNKYVPLDPTNRDYQKIQEWVAAGNTIAEAD
tara:strand:- start:17 stop:175 length:159 start_codon:yes stop_codon:yes gene_type:complete